MCDHGRAPFRWMNFGDRIEAPLLGGREMTEVEKLGTTRWTARCTARQRHLGPVVALVSPGVSNEALSWRAKSWARSSRRRPSGWNAREKRAFAGGTEPGAAFRAGAEIAGSDRPGIPRRIRLGAQGSSQCRPATGPGRRPGTVCRPRHSRIPTSFTSAPIFLKLPAGRAWCYRSRIWRKTAPSSIATEGCSATSGEISARHGAARLVGVRGDAALSGSRRFDLFRAGSLRPVGPIRSRRCWNVLFYPGFGGAVLPPNAAPVSRYDA